MKYLIISYLILSWTGMSVWLGWNNERYKYMVNVWIISGEELLVKIAFAPLIVPFALLYLLGRYWGRKKRMSL